MKQSQTKKVYIYPIKDNDGTPLDLINVLTHVPDHSTGSLVLDRVDTFIGRHDRGEYIKVGSTENLSAPGVIFRYASYVREQEALLSYYLDCYHENLYICTVHCTFIGNDIKPGVRLNIEQKKTWTENRKQCRFCLFLSMIWYIFA